MRTSKKSFMTVLLPVLFILVSVLNNQVTARDYYQLKVYTIKDQAQEKTIDKYLKEAYIPAMHRAGAEAIGVFKPIADDPAAGTKVFVFIPIKKLEDIVKLEDKLAGDKVYQQKGADYINASHDNPPFERIESILMRAFTAQPKYFVPQHKTPVDQQIYELRSYYGPTEKYYRKKVEMFSEAGETALFKTLEFNAVFYGEVISGSTMPNLMYMTTFSDMASQEEHWNAFRVHPTWEKLKGMDEYKNTVSNIDKWLMHPTEYSDI